MSKKMPSKKDLEQYLDLEAKAREIQRQMEELKASFIEAGTGEFDVADIHVKIEEASRSIAKPREKIVELLGAKVAARIFRRISFTKVSVRRAS